MYKNVVEKWCKEHNITDKEIVEHLTGKAQYIDKKLYEQFLIKCEEVILQMLDKERIPHGSQY